MYPITHFVYPYIIPKNPIFGWELLYSIRSIYRHFKGPFDITLIGEIPTWVDTNEIRCIELHNNDYGLRVQSKTNQKILLAADMYKDFVVMHDDYYLLHTCLREDLTQVRYLSENLNYSPHTDKGLTRFQKQIRHTYFELLKRHRKATRNFCTHAPFFYKGKKIKQLHKEFDLTQTGEFSIITENAYWNYFKKESKEAIPLDNFRQGFWGNHKKEVGLDPSAIILNHDERGFMANTWLLNELTKQFPNKCKGEL